MSKRARLACALALFGALLAARLAHLRVLWTEEAYPTAAALQILNGKTLYRDIWYDKPPLSALVYLLWDARSGLPLRLAQALYLALSCALLWRLARRLWSEREAWLAASLLAFFFIFDIPASVSVLGPDLLMTAPHIAALSLALRKKPALAGAAAALAFLFNTKGLFVLASCALFCPSLSLALGFLLPNAAALALLALAGALPAYYQQVWQWGFLYASDSPFAHPFLEALRRTLDWSGFHAALLLGAAFFFTRRSEPLRKQFALWLALSFASVAGGWRFFPRYFLQLLPPAAASASRGLSRIGPWRWLALAALAVPLVRFGPRYVILANDALHNRPPLWSDLALSQDALAAAAILHQNARPSDTLLVWGYRPEIFAASRIPAASRFLDSQPLTGVIADRHLTSSIPSAPTLAAANRRALLATSPTWIVDALAPLNPSLAITRYPDLAPWLAHYRPFARTPTTAIYRRLP